MNFRKLITYSYLVAFIIPSINAAFLNCSPVKALEEITDGSKPKNPFSSQYNLVSHTNDPPHLKKQLQAKQRFNLLFFRLPCFQTGAMILCFSLLSGMFFRLT
ncbi:hypothetical protein BY996DRAFT_7175360 [Phakopsora pachyrhizi]|nr:hypothetical protein BY996DRAFT_7175360 [Phakopsora pachyrhizi]